MQTISRRQILGAVSTMGLAPLAMSRDAAAAQTGLDLPFVLHAVFFSNELHLAKPVDPHAFVRDASAQAAVGPQDIPHAAAFRPALVARPFDVEAFNAQGKSLGFTLADWFAAKGSVKITPSGSGAKVDCQFTQLRPNGVYSPFENHFDRKPIGFTPQTAQGKTTASPRTQTAAPRSVSSRRSLSPTITPFFWSITATTRRTASSAARSG